MQRLLAIDGDSQELWFVAASAEGEQITLEAAASIPLKGTSDDAVISPEELGKKLHGALSKYKRSGTKVLLGVDRSSVELFKFTVPPTSDAELAELVTNLVATESPSTADEAIIDFVVSPGSATESRKVSAAALSKSQLQRWNAVCSAAGLTPNRMLVRPYSIAALFLKQRPASKATTLLVSVIGIDVDIVVVEDSSAVFFRSVKLPAGTEDEPARQRLLQEIRRTLVVAPQSGDVSQPIKNIVLFGITPGHQQLIEQLSSDGSVTAELIDPLQSFEVTDPSAIQGSTQLVSMLGMLVAETQTGQHPIDFLQPKKAARPVNQRRRIVTAMAAVLVIAAMGLYLVRERFAAADEEIKQLTDDLKTLEKTIKKNAEKRQVAESLEEWNRNSIVWLDELRNLSTGLPSGQDMVLQRLNVSSSRGGKGLVSFQGLAREPQVITQMEVTLRDDRHEVQTPRIEERAQEKTLSWGFETAISVTPAKPKTETASNED